MRTLVGKKLVEKFPIYDIEVKGDHCFELYNGVIAHNSMYPTAVISGGCMVAGSKVVMADGNYKNIEDITPGDRVYTHLGNYSVTHTWNPNTLNDGNPACYEVLLSDGEKFTVSEKHMFLAEDKITWIRAKDLKQNDKLFNANGVLFHSVVSSTPVGNLPVYDLTVDSVNCYTMHNGIVSHNTGLMYSANQAFIITKAQEKDADGLAGWKFTINIEKSRFVKEKSKLPFTVLYNKGIQKWSSLFDLALEAGHIIKPKVGWYQLVDIETGEVSDKNYRAKEIETNDEFFTNLINDPSFKKFVESKFKLSGSMTTAEEVDLNDTE